MARAGINANWLLTGEGPMRLADLAKPGEVSAERVYAPIPRHVIVGKDGVETDVPSEVASLALNLEWLTQRGLRPVDLTYVRMPDDSMSPTIRQGSMIVMDSSSDKFRGDGIYGLIHNGEAAVKRLQKNFSGGLYIRSDSPAYREQFLTDDQVSRLCIIGKVIWAGGEI